MRALQRAHLVGQEPQVLLCILPIWQHQAEPARASVTAAVQIAHLAAYRAIPGLDRVRWNCGLGRFMRWQYSNTSCRGERCHSFISIPSRCTCKPKA